MHIIHKATLHWATGVVIGQQKTTVQEFSAGRVLCRALAQSWPGVVRVKGLSVTETLDRTMKDSQIAMTLAVVAKAAIPSAVIINTLSGPMTRTTL
jgi:hypothetical protein